MIGATSLRYSAVLCTLLLSVASASAETLQGYVVGVSDGDTITVLDETNTQHKVRVAGIDAPEKKQPFGIRAKQKMSDLVYDKEVSVAWAKVDRYGRKVGQVWVRQHDCSFEHCRKTLDAGLAMLTTGLAWWYRKYQGEQNKEDRGRYAFAEQEARARHAGLWRDPRPEPPWDYRKRLADERASTHGK